MDESDPWICSIWRIWLIMVEVLSVRLHDEVLRVGVEDVRQGHHVLERGRGEGLLLVRLQLHLLGNLRPFLHLRLLLLGEGRHKHLASLDPSLKWDSILFVRAGDTFLIKLSVNF